MYVPVHLARVGSAGAALVTIAVAIGTTAGAGVALDTAADDHEYRWVDPPPVHEPHNVAPQGRTAQAVPGIETFWTPDMQVQLRWSDRLEPVPVTIEVLPLSARALPPLPSDAEPAGNAYRIAFTPRRVVDGVVLHLRVPGDIDRVYVTESDERGWRSVPFAPEEPGIITVDWQGDGAVLAATSDERTPPWILFASAAGGGAALGLVGLWLGRRRRAGAGLEEPRVEL